MAHSNQVREFILTAEGIRLRAAYIGPDGVLTGSARLAQEAKDKADRLLREQEIERRSRAIERRRREIKTQIEALEDQLATEETEVKLLNREGLARAERLVRDRVEMGTSRSSSRTNPNSEEQSSKVRD